jgi:hypothetical protein
MTLEDFLSRLNGVKLSGTGWTALCPAHDDRNPSLSVSEGDDDLILIHCHAGCPSEAILAALGLEERDLFATSTEARPRQVEGYPYVDETGAVLFEVVRFEPKKFQQRRPNGRGGWIWKLGGTRRVLYRLPEVLAAAVRGDLIYVAEGERDVHSLEAVGAVATTSPGGAGKWRSEYAESLRGAQVVVIADDDKRGIAHALAVAASLPPGTARIVRAAVGKDVTDHLNAGKTLDELVPLDPTDRAVPPTPPGHTAALETPNLGEVLDEIAKFIRRFVVLGPVSVDAIALWVAHTWVYATARVTPYLHPFSPEKGSGKTTLLDVLAIITRHSIQADNVSEAVLFRLVESERPTLLIDEVDAIFGRKNTDSAEGIRQVLNSGYIKGKKAYRCVPPSMAVKGFDVYCPKALAGLRELPDTLAHRAIPIALQPPRPDEAYDDFDPEEVESEAESLRLRLAAWAAAATDALQDPRLKPAKVPELDPRGNQIWRILLRIADLAGGHWPARARTAAVELSGATRVEHDGSPSVQLLNHIRDIFRDERMLCSELVHALNDDELPYGGWNAGDGLTTRELGRKLAPFRIKSKTIRIGDNRGYGYERTQFEDAWSRYLPPPHTENRDTVTIPVVEPSPGQTKPRQGPGVTVSRYGSTRHEHSDVTVDTVPEAGSDQPGRQILYEGALRYVLTVARLLAWQDIEPDLRKTSAQFTEAELQTLHDAWQEARGAPA